MILIPLRVITEARWSLREEECWGGSLGPHRKRIKRVSVLIHYVDEFAKQYGKGTRAKE